MKLWWPDWQLEVKNQSPADQIQLDWRPHRSQHRATHNIPQMHWLRGIFFFTKNNSKTNWQSRIEAHQFLILNSWFWVLNSSLYQTFSQWKVFHFQCVIYNQAATTVSNSHNNFFGSTSHAVISQSHRVISQPYIMISQPYIMISQSYLMISQSYIMISQSYIMISPSYIMISPSYIMISQSHISITETW